jgi:hypothetical protein
MADTTAPPATRPLVVLGASLPDAEAPVRRNLSPSRSDVDRAEDLPQSGLGTVYSGRLQRFTSFAKSREGSISRTASSQALAATTREVIRSIEEGVE